MSHSPTHAVLLTAAVLVGSGTLAAQDSPIPPAPQFESAVVLPILEIYDPLEPAVEPLTYALPARDSSLQRGLDRILSSRRFRDHVRRGELSVALVDLSTGRELRYAAHDDDHMRYAASLPKIGIMLGVFAAVDRGEVRYTPALRRKLERMIRDSSNPIASELIELVGFDTIEDVLRDPHYRLYDSDRSGGIWVGRGYGSGVGTWQRDPISGISHGATARQVIRFLVMMEHGELISPWASGEMKRIMGNPGLRHKFVRGLMDFRPLSRIFRKSGTFRNWHADAAIVERAGRRYAVVALLDSPDWRGVLPDLIVEVDRLLIPPARSDRVSRPGSAGLTTGIR